MKSPECYVLQSQRKSAPIPARVVKEGKTTVTVEFTYPSGVTDTKTFNKRKGYGDHWVDPRTESNSLKERGESGYGYGSYRLRFDAAKVEAEYEEEQRDNHRAALRQVTDKGIDVEGALMKANVPADSPLYVAWTAFKDALVETIKEAGGE